MSFSEVQIQLLSDTIRGNINTSALVTLVVLCSRQLIGPADWVFLSHCDPYAVISLETVAYSSYCNMVEWFWWDWSLSQRPTGFLQCFDAVGWVIWPVKIVPEMTYKVSSGTSSLYSLPIWFLTSLPASIAYRCRLVLADYNMSCDDVGIHSCCLVDIGRFVLSPISVTLLLILCAQPGWSPKL